MITRRFTESSLALLPHGHLWSSCPFGRGGSSQLGDADSGLSPYDSSVTDDAEVSVAQQLSPDRGLRLSLGLQNSCWSPRTARSNGCACRAGFAECFRSLVGPRAGTFRFAPSSTAAYHTNVAIWPGRWCWKPPGTPRRGWVVVQDLLVVAKVRPGQRGPVTTGRRGTSAATGTLLRLAKCVEGRVEVLGKDFPVFEYGLGSRGVEVRWRWL